MVHFAVEIWLRIINTLRITKHPSAYQLDTGCSAALASLCLVNHTFQYVAEPILYSLAFITPESLEAFSRTVALDGEHTGDELTFNPTKRGSWVKTLAFANFEDELTSAQAWRINRTLCSLRFGITRLLMGVNLPEEESANTGLLGYAVPLLDNLEELCTIGSFPPWPKTSHSQWQRLKRVCFVQRRSFAVLPTLTPFPTIDTYIYLDLRDGYVFGDLVNHCMHTPELKGVTAIIPTAQSKSFCAGVRTTWRSLFLRVDLQAMARCREVMGRCQMIKSPDAPSTSRHPTTQEIAFFTNAVIHGYVWDMEGRPLLELLRLA
ncbi:hypothetical protein FRB94_000704 [Tulasnella sp. JGI-2019a]|nr:hypothetical protein FRB94_000704 [Tulasnella sp. JGI-2019a]KAG9030115.1 hypothetical protein FRB95_004304 [Tulasnella sp. JGI-2019a]